MEDEVMDIQAVADALGVSVQTVRRLIKRGKLKPLPHAPALQRPKALLFSKAAVMAYQATLPPAEQA